MLRFRDRLNSCPCWVQCQLDRNPVGWPVLVAGDTVVGVQLSRVRSEVPFGVAASGRHWPVSGTRWRMVPLVGRMANGPGGSHSWEGSELSWRVSRQRMFGLRIWSLVTCASPVTLLATRELPSTP